MSDSSPDSQMQHSQLSAFPSDAELTAISNSPPILPPSQPSSQAMLLHQWNVACLRLEDYLRAHRVQDRELQLRLTLEILDQAKAEHQLHPQVPPLDITLRLLTARLDHWFSQLIDPVGEVNPQNAARGRVAYFGAGIDQRWPSAFLTSDPPSELITAIRGTTLQSGPHLEFSSLLRQEVDYGPMEDIASETWGHVLKAFVIWVGIFFLVYGIYLSLWTS